MNPPEYKKNSYYRLPIKNQLTQKVSHAIEGGDYEIMGLLQGKIDKKTIIVTNVIELPVEGTETRLNRNDFAIGWYHSHPGYGCWLSGIDVSTQTLNQQYQDPWIAIVVDPKKTISSGKVSIGAFRCYPEGEKVQKNTHINTVKLSFSKKEEYSAFADMYYELEISYFKSSLDERFLRNASYSFVDEPRSISEDYENRLQESLENLELVKSIKSELFSIQSVQNRDNNLSRLLRNMQNISRRSDKEVVSQIIQNTILGPDNN
ncbi:hypothetical protein BB560_005139 [Smittium megazygosporum]|uniref:COP9 signalosome complex subunit 5 n=1 Tax=Smittium megazygosporum TaxID=133381 RepID=A0A2T9Z7A4_9FUNG|nr:hypothetical protein BB560_005139 [Smittium megazygosporum]